MEITASVLISTYNGEKYILEQLESIKNQSYKVEQVVIKDDCSTDSTCEIIEQYIKENKLEQWTLIKNQQNIGWMKNFMSLLEFATGNYIFFCDQDDIWHNDKVEKMLLIMDNNPKVQLLVSDYEIYVCDQGKYDIQKDKKAREILEQYTTKKNFLYTRYPGCVYCARRKFVELYKEQWMEDMPHDAFVWHLAYMLGGLYVFREKTIKYRRHRNTVTGRSIGKKAERLQDIQYYKSLLSMYHCLEEHKNFRVKQKEIQKVEQWVLNREKILVDKSVSAMIKNLFYLKYYWSYKTYFMDLFVAIKNKG